MLIGNPVKPGSVVRGRKEPAEELESERVKRAASELGSLGGKARAARMPPEREIARRVKGGENPCASRPMEGTFARTRLFGWKDVNPGRKS